MSDSESGKLDEMTSRIKDVVASAESHVDAEGLLHRIREAVGKVGNTVDSDALVGRFKEVAGQAEGKIDAGRLRQWVAEVDRDKLKGWLEEAQHLGAGAVSVIGTQGEKLADRAPGAFDKLAGAAKERLGTLTGDEGLSGSRVRSRRPLLRSQRWPRAGRRTPRRRSRRSWAKSRGATSACSAHRWKTSAQRRRHVEARSNLVQRRVCW
jgi:hypothetical protein